MSWAEGLEGLQREQRESGSPVGGNELVDVLSRRNHICWFLRGVRCLQAAEKHLMPFLEPETLSCVWDTVSPVGSLGSGCMGK